jgi:hypothetical protein
MPCEGRDGKVPSFDDAMECAALGTPYANIYNNPQLSYFDNQMIVAFNWGWQMTFVILLCLMYVSFKLKTVLYPKISVGLVFLCFECYMMKWALWFNEPRHRTAQFITLFLPGVLIHYLLFMLVKVLDLWNYEGRFPPIETIEDGWKLYDAICQEKSLMRPGASRERTCHAHLLYILNNYSDDEEFMEKYEEYGIDEGRVILNKKAEEEYIQQGFWGLRRPHTWDVSHGSYRAPCERWDSFFAIVDENIFNVKVLSGLGVTSAVVRLFL